MPINLDDLSDLLEQDCNGNDPAFSAARTMAQLSHPQRLRVLCLLVERGELSVADLLEQIPLTASALSQHLARMTEERLITVRADGRRRYYALSKGPVSDLLAVLQKHFCAPEGARAAAE